MFHTLQAGLHMESGDIYASFLPHSTEIQSSFFNETLEYKFYYENFYFQL